MSTWSPTLVTIDGTPDMEEVHFVISEVMFLL